MVFVIAAANVDSAPVPAVVLIAICGIVIGWYFFSIGPLRLGTATLGAALAIGIGHWLSIIEMGEVHSEF